MSRKKPELDIDPALDVQHELPSAEEPTNTTETIQMQAPNAEETPASNGDVQRLKKERDTLLDRLARLQAEFQNARKSLAREQQEFKTFALEDTLKSLLPVLDSFDRAIQAPESSMEEFRSGVELIQRQVHGALAKLGLRPIPAKGEPFDPNLHEAIEMVDGAEAGDNYVVDELQRGYTLGPRLLRPAMVRVGKKPA